MDDPLAEQRNVQSAAESPHWADELTFRMRTGFVRTTLSTSLLTGVFFVAYFFVQQHPIHPPFIMPLTSLDLTIPFEAPFLLAYVSLWVYVGVGPGLVRTVLEFSIYGIWLALLCVSGLVIFYFWPTQVPEQVIAATHFPGFVMLHRVDEASNACPSMHVAVAIFTVIRVAQVLRTMRVPLAVHAINATWFSAIVYSTLAIKQHVVLDVIAGAVLGILFAAMSLRWRPSSTLSTSLPNDARQPRVTPVMEVR